MCYVATESAGGALNTSVLATESTGGGALNTSVLQLNLLGGGGGH